MVPRGVSLPSQRGISRRLRAVRATSLEVGRSSRAPEEPRESQGMPRRQARRTTRRKSAESQAIQLRLSSPGPRPKRHLNAPVAATWLTSMCRVRRRPEAGPPRPSARKGSELQHERRPSRRRLRRFSGRGQAETAALAALSCPWSSALGCSL